jgi:hypothetical protein
MVRTKLSRYLLVLSAPLLLEVFMIPSFLTTAPIQAKTPTQTNDDSVSETRLRRMRVAQTSERASARLQIADRRVKRVTFEPRRDQPAPTVTIGGGRRNNGNCSQIEQASAQPAQSLPLDQLLTPLLPSPFSNLQLTVSAHPTFLVYVPQTSATVVEFTLLTTKDNNKEEGIYQTTVKLTGTPGIVRISLPTSAPELEIGKDYKWLVTMACQADGPTVSDPFTEGLVRRIQPDSSLSQLDQAKPLDRVALYAKSGFWYEASANLAALRQAQPNDPEVASAWQELLQGAGLGAIANAPLK